MGRRSRRADRAAEVLERTYATGVQGHRLALGALRNGVGVGGDAPGAVEGEVAAVHDAAFTRAWSAALAEGGPAWAERTGTSEAAESARLWSEHLEPLTGLAPPGSR